MLERRLNEQDRLLKEKDLKWLLLKKKPENVVFRRHRKSVQKNVDM
jgi:hypothetical protein